MSPQSPDGGDSTGEQEPGPYYYYLETIFSNIQELSLNEKDFHPEKKFITGHQRLANQSLIKNLHTQP